MKRTWGEYVATIILAIGAALIVRTFLVTAYKVPTGSMRPALLPGDFVFVNRLPVLFSNQPKLGELVALKGVDGTEVSYLKRIIAIEGDKVELKDGILYLNDLPATYEEKLEQENVPNPEVFKLVDEILPYGRYSILVRRDQVSHQFGPLIVPPGEVFLLGDNRDTSEDSRFWGTVPIKHIFGKVSLIWMSIEPARESGRKSPRIRWERVLDTPQ